MTLRRISAFSDGHSGGNPAGVLLADSLPDAADMQQIAAQVGYSETAFAAPGPNGWVTRYFAPETEVPFCGHATIALGVALGQAHGAGRYDLVLRETEISVTAQRDEAGHWTATLSSPATRSQDLAGPDCAALLALFGLAPSDLDPRLPLRLAHAGASHAVLALRDRDRLAAMAYDFDTGRDLMQRLGLVTISLVWIEDQTTFVTRNAFAVGGVVEDPATGAAAAALGGMLVDLGWPGLTQGGRFRIRQGEDMGAPSLLTVAVTGQPGAPVEVSGRAHVIEQD